MGHFVMSRIHGVEATPPYFIPGPPFLVGTFGAFIRMHTPTNRKALFDVGAAGPWAGFLVAIPAVFYGLSLSEVRALDPSSGGLILGESLVFTGLTHLALGVSPADATILLHPIALAGWFGLFVTFLNLLPVGQLDGGHVVYSLIGHRHRWVARVALLVIIGLAFLGWQGWAMWAVLVTLLGLDHPPTIDDTPLDPARRVAAWLTIGLFVITFAGAPDDRLTLARARSWRPKPHAARIRCGLPPGEIPGPCTASSDASTACLRRLRLDDIHDALVRAGEEPIQVAAARQVHGATVLAPEDMPAVATNVVAADLPPGDAWVSASADLLLTIRTADCVPILLVAPRARAVAAVHAGWRGTLAGVIEAALAALASRYDARADEVAAAIGPVRCCMRLASNIATFVTRFGASAATAWREDPDTGRAHLEPERSAGSALGRRTAGGRDHDGRPAPPTTPTSCTPSGVTARMPAAN
jgi:Zn-dependent protease